MTVKLYHKQPFVVLFPNGEEWTCYGPKFEHRSHVWDTGGSTATKVVEVSVHGPRAKLSRALVGPPNNFSG